ncbi:hypothetical protein JCM10212_006904 [Sporobolomyces blumeae]
MKRFSRAATAALATAVLSIAVRASSLVAPEQAAIAFFWSTYNDSLFEIPQCSGFQVFTTENAAAPRSVVEPLYFTAFPIGFEPETIALPNKPIGTGFTWNANYPVGTKLTLAMADAANNSGGAVDRYTITQSSLTNCTIIEQNDAPISLAVDPPNNPCDEIDLQISGGRSPYTISVLAGQSGMYANVTGVKSKNVKLQNVVAAGQVFNLLVTDSTGSFSEVSGDMVSSLNLASCNMPTGAFGGSSTPIGAIVGGVIGGLAAAVIVGLLAWWLIRRRSKKRQEEYRQAQLASSEFRTADGRAPLVEPFMLQTQGPAVRNAGAGDAYVDVSPTHEGSYDKSLDTYPSSPSNAYPSDHPQYYTHPLHQNPASTSTTPYESAHDYSPYRTGSAYSHPYDPYDSSAAPSGGYPSYDPSTAPPGSSSRYESQPSQAPSSSSATDDLANPEEFEYRLTDQNAWTSTSSHLPAGARPYR